MNYSIKTLRFELTGNDGSEARKAAGGSRTGVDAGGARWGASAVARRGRVAGRRRASAGHNWTSSAHGAAGHAVAALRRGCVDGGTVAAGTCANNGAGRLAVCGGGGGNKGGSLGLGARCLGGRGRRGRLLAAGQVVKGVAVDVGWDDTERRRGGSWLGITKSVPESVDLSDQLAGHGLPVGLGVRGGGLGRARHLTGYRPAGLGNPHRLPVGGLDGGLVRGVEQRLAVVDGVLKSGLEVWVSIETEPVNGLNDSVVGRVSPVVPGVDVSDGEAPVLGLNLVDVFDQSVRSGTNARLVDHTSWADAVEVLRADR